MNVSVIGLPSTRVPETVTPSGASAGDAGLPHGPGMGSG